MAEAGQVGHLRARRVEAVVVKRIAVNGVYELD